jgi:hypothetical protein
MLDAAMLSQIQAALAEVRGDRDEDIVFRRGGASLASQNVRIENAAIGAERNSEGTGESRGRITLLMAVGADVQVDDRFNDQYGQLYRVVIVRPNRSLATIAQAVVVE